MLGVKRYRRVFPLGGCRAVTLLACVAVSTGVTGIVAEVGRCDNPSATHVAEQSPTLKRIITIAPNAAEIICALGVGERIVGVSKFCVYPPELKERPRVGGLFDPNLEKIVHIDDFPTKKSAQLLAYLILNPNRSHSRELLAEVIGGPELTGDPRKGIRQELWVIRSVLKDSGIDPGRYLATHGEGIAFNRNPDFWFDVDCFQDSTASVKQPTIGVPTLDEVDRLESALELYRGDLLPGFYDDWCLYPRESLRDLYLMALERLMSHYQQHGAWNAAISVGKRWLDADDLSESVHRILMRCYYAKGHRAAALRQFDRCKELLGRELGVEPMLETRTLYAQIKSEQMGKVPPMGHARGETPGAEKNPAAVKRKSSLAGLAGTVSNLKAAHMKMAGAIRDLEDFDVEEPETAHGPAKSTPRKRPGA